MRYSADLTSLSICTSQFRETVRRGQEVNRLDKSLCFSLGEPSVPMQKISQSFRHVRTAIKKRVWARYQPTLMQAAETLGW